MNPTSVQRLIAQRRKPEETIIEGCAYIYKMYLQSEYTVCIPDEISICSNRGRMESLGNDDVSSLNARMESLGNDDVSLQNARKYLVGNDCDVTMTGLAVNEKSLRVFWLLSHVKRLQAAYVTLVFHRVFTKRFTFTLLVLSNITNTMRKTLSDRFL